jgi:CMP-N-acetylneuraminic acid synthetase
MHIALITAKGGNQSIENKNIVNINGMPSMAWSIEAAKNSKFIDAVFVSTECPLISKVAKKFGAIVLDRPNDLSQPFSNHGEVIQFAHNQIKERYLKIDTITILLGNTVMTKAEDIDNAISTVIESSEIDSAMTVWKAQDDHPLRAMKLDQNNNLVSYLDNVRPDTNRQSYEDVYFYDQGPWTVKSSTLDRTKEKPEGPGPWWWMGKNCKALERQWVTGRDTHSQFDIDVAVWWLNNYNS